MNLRGDATKTSEELWFKRVPLSSFSLGGVAADTYSYPPFLMEGNRLVTSSFFNIALCPGIGYINLLLPHDDGGSQKPLVLNDIIDEDADVTRMAGLLLGQRIPEKSVMPGATGLKGFVEDQYRVDTEQEN